MSPKSKKSAASTAITLHVPSHDRLPDNKLWENRFEIRSEKSNRIYVIAQNKAKRHWGCSCPRYCTTRTCKHLKALALPEHEKPYEVLIG